MQKGIALILFLVLGAGFCFAQDAYWYLDKPIKDIIFTGLDHIRADELRGLTDPFIGRRFTNELFLDLQSKILALRYFDQFKANAIEGDPERNTVIIEFIVKEVPLIKKIEINGNKSVRTTDILDVIMLSEDDLMSKTIARLDVQEIEKLYKEKGFPDVNVEYEIRDRGKNACDLIFTITEGKQTRIKSIVFVGNNIISSGTLKRKLESKVNSLIYSGIYQEENIKLDKENIEVFYHERGYIDAKVIDIVKNVISEEDADKIELEVTYYVEEGKQWTFNSIAVEGNTLFTDEQILEKIRFTKGKIINQLKMQQDFEAVKDIYYNDGYVANNFSFRENRNEEELSIDFLITIYERPRSHIENIIIKGNEKTKDYVLYREIPLQVGDIFYKDKISQGIMNLYNLNYFDNIEVDTPLGSADGLLDLVINVEEGKTSNIEFGISFTGQHGTFPVTGFFKYTDTNFKGKGQEISIGTNISSSTQNIELGFKENWLKGKRWYGGGKISLQHRLVQDALQDREVPVGNGAPDPYSGYYVYADTGLPWTDSPWPTQEEIDEYDLITDYEYARQNGEDVDPDYLMKYDSYELILEGNTGYTHHTNWHRIRLGIGGGLAISLSYIDYDADAYRPYEETVRDNYQTLNYVGTAKLTLSVDNRDSIYYPSRGFVFKQYVNYTGGFLFGSKDFIKTTSAAEVYFKLFDVPVTREWNYKNILALHSAIQFFLPQWALQEDNTWGWVDDARTSTDLLYIDGMSMARGWPALLDLESIWDSWIELRMPLSERMFWLDTFFSVTGGWSKYDGIKDMAIQDFRFSFGFGIRSVIPMLPIGFYIVKRFKFNDDDEFEWQAGAIDKDGLGLDFVISFNQNL
ncbi:MAG: outer membrane protein assembly factor BamA [Spirochaetales bacterium]|nr:outer membrane protein assembly factor BamA [Spirochaetales bacterium]